MECDLSITAPNCPYHEPVAYSIAKSVNMRPTRIHLKNRILVQDRGGAKFQTGGILLYVEDLKRGTNKEVGPKDIFEMDSKFDRSMTIF
jgi:hypothetical protein